MQKCEQDINLLHLVNLICGENLTWTIIKELAKSDGLTLRELARRCSVTPKTLYKHLNHLTGRGLVEIHRPSPRILLIKISEKHQWIRQIFAKPQQ